MSVSETIGQPDIAGNGRVRLATTRQALRYGRTRLGIVLTMLVVAVAVIGPLTAPYSPTAFVGPPFSGPSGTAVLGTDDLGQDVLSRLLWGGWSVVWMAIAATALGVLVGVAIGLIAGYGRSWLDDAIMSAVDVLLAFPQIVLALLFVSVLGPQLWLIVLIVALSHVPRVARLTRSMTLDVTQRDFVRAAEAIGAPRRWILVREILPSVTTPLMVEFGIRLTWSIAIIAGLSFLGFGIQPPNADWGLMINENRNGIAIAPWAVVAPVLCIAVFAVGTNLIAEGFGRAVAGLDREARAR